MKKYLTLLILILLSISLSAQNYIAISNSLSAVPGNIAIKANSSIEFGKQWDVFSLGLVVGETQLNKLSDLSTMYGEIRSNLNIFQQGKFVNTCTMGMGYVANQDHTLLLEISYTIEYSLTEQFHINILAGQYYYSGYINNTNENFVGLSLVYFFKNYKTKSIINGNTN